MRQLLMEADAQYMVNHHRPEYRINPAVAAVVESIAEKYESKEGANDGWLSSKVNWAELQEAAINNPQALQEANPSTAFGQLLRAGIQTIANGWYRRYGVQWTGIALEAKSDKRQEFYPPLYGSQFPRKVGAGTPYREGRVVGQDREIINVKWGLIESFDRELFDDDQTGQIAQRAQRMGESAAAWEDAYFSRRFVGTEDLSFPEKIDASGWDGVNASGTLITQPFDVNLYDTGLGNRPAAFTQLTYGPLLTAYQRLRQAIDPLGVAIVVAPTVLTVSTFDELNAKMLIQSTTAPFVPPAAGGASQGEARGQFAMNPVQGLLKLNVNVYYKAGVAALGEGNKGYIFQRRDPMEIVQELPQSGQSFEIDAYRFRERSRWEQEWIEPRFWYMINDGTAALTQS